MTPPNQSSPALPKIKEDGLTILFDNTDPGGKNVDIVFIHGLNGHPYYTWKNTETSFYWPFELHSCLKKSRVMTFGYNAGIKSELAQNFIRIKGIAATLTNALANQRNTQEELNRVLIFVGHSMGGLVAKSAAFTASQAQVTGANDLDKLYAAIGGFMFFGVPHSGSKMLNKNRVWILQKMAKAAFIEIPPKVEKALKDGSDELLDLADNFRKISLYVDGNLVIASFYEQLATAGLGDRVVDESSAFIHYPKANDPQPINSNHINMVKFKGGDEDGSFEDIKALLIRWETRLSEPVSGA